MNVCVYSRNSLYAIHDASMALRRRNECEKDGDTTHQILVAILRSLNLILIWHSMFGILFSSLCQTKNIMTTTTPFTSHPLPIHTLPTLNFKLNFNLFFCVWIFFISVGRGSFWISICLSVCLLVVHRESRLFTLLVHTIIVWSLAHQWNKFAVCINSQFRIVYRY